MPKRSDIKGHAMYTIGWTDHKGVYHSIQRELHASQYQAMAWWAVRGNMGGAGIDFDVVPLKPREWWHELGSLGLAIQQAQLVEYSPMHSSKIRTLSAKELRDTGIVQEANRQFFHPLGLQLVVKMFSTIPQISVESVDDQDGIIFADPEIELAEKFEAFRAGKHEFRQKALGFIVQPLLPPDQAPKKE